MKREVFIDPPAFIEHLFCAGHFFRCQGYRGALDEGLASVELGEINPELGA